MFGGGLSYDALEGHLRKFRPEARKMIAAAKDAEPAPKSAGPRRKSSAAKSTTSRRFILSANILRALADNA